MQGGRSLTTLVIIQNANTEYLLAPTNTAEPYKHLGVRLSSSCTGNTYSNVTIVDNTCTDTTVFDNADVCVFIEYELDPSVISDKIFRDVIPYTKSNVIFCSFFEPFYVQHLHKLADVCASRGNTWYLSVNAKINEIDSIPANLKTGFFDFFSGFLVHGQRFYASEPPAQKNVAQRDFLCLIAKKRPHRVFMMDLLKRYNILNNGHVSFGRAFLEGESQVSAREYGNANVRIPCFDDITDWTSKVFFEIICDHVVMPTDQGADYIFLSEKLYRAIYNKMPFLIYAKPKTLDRLHDLGYKTYNMLFDEAYDSITDWQSRGRAIAKQAEKFCKMSESDKLQWHQTAKKIAEYNYSHLLNNLSSIHLH